MTTDSPTLFERAGDDWYLSMDTRHVPEYVVLTLQGKPSTARTAGFLELMETHDAAFTNARGRYYPVIVDLSALPPPTLDGLRSGRAMIEGASRKQSYLVFLVTPERRRSPVFGVLLALMARIAPNRFAVTTTMEEAVAAVRSYHERAS